MKNILINNKNLYYIDEGEGFPIIFLHNGGGFGEMWRRQISYFSQKGFRVIAPDLPGFGSSEDHECDLTLTYYSLAIKDFLEALSIERTHFVGLCIGTSILLNLSHLVHLNVTT